MVGQRLSLLSKICYALGGLPFQMLANSIGLYIAPFLLEIAQLRPLQISIILFTAKAWDAVTDPLVGFLVSKTRTRFGKFRPWIILSSPFCIVTFLMIWYVPRFLDNEIKTVWYLVSYCLYQFFSSCNHVPYTSLTMSLTPNQRERDSATGYRMICEISGVLLAALIQGVMITVYGAKVSCADRARMLFSNNSNSNFSIPFPTYSKLGEGYLVSAGIMCFILFICSCAVFCGTREMKDVIRDVDTHFGRAIKSIFKHKSYITILLAFMFYSLSIQIVQTNVALYCKYSIDAKDTYQIVLIVLLVSSVISLPFWNWLMVKVGKKATYATGALAMIPFLIMLMFLPKSGWYLYVISGICGVCVAANFLLPWSMLPDVIDEFMIKTGSRHESIFYSFYVFFTKIASGISLAITSVILDLSGYIDCPDGCCTQPESVGKTLRLLIGPGPIVMLLISAFFIIKHSINEKRRIEIQDQLNFIREQNLDNISHEFVKL